MSNNGEVVSLDLFRQERSVAEAHRQQEQRKAYVFLQMAELSLRSDPRYLYFSDEIKAAGSYRLKEAHLGVTKHLVEQGDEDIIAEVNAAVGDTDEAQRNVGLPQDPEYLRDWLDAQIQKLTEPDNQQV
jgi:hypothetical protein